MSTILVVDDRVQDRELLVDLLQHAQYRILEAADGAEALRQMRAEHPDLVICDVLLPKMDGYEIVRQLRADPAIRQTTVIFYTAAFNEREARDLAHDCGVELILSKPTEPKKILKSIAMVLGSEGAQAIPSPPASFEQKHQQLLIDKLIRQVDALHRSEERSTWQARILTAINRVFHEALTCETEEELGRTCLAAAEELTGSRFGFIGEMNQAGVLEHIAVSGPGCAAFQRPGAKQSHLPKCLPINGYYYRAVNEEQSVITNNPAAPPDSIGTPPGYPPITAFLGVPLKHGGKTIGMVGLVNKEPGYDHADQEAVETLSFAMVEAFMRKRAEQALRLAHEELEQRVQERTAELRDSEQKLHNLTSQVFTAQEKERKRISLEIHDELGQNLTALKLHLRAVQQTLPEDPGQIKEDFEHALSQLTGIVENVRRISRDLSPSVLEHYGLQAALRFLLDEFKKYLEAQIVLHIDDIEPLFSFQDKANIYRIFQEGLTNIVKHGQATRISINIHRQDGQVFFSIADDGIGFDLAEVSARRMAERGMGLGSMEERLRMMGGKLNIQSQKGSGTCIHFTIPFSGSN